MKQLIVYYSFMQNNELLAKAAEDGCADMTWRIDFNSSEAKAMEKSSLVPEANGPLWTNLIVVCRNRITAISCIAPAMAPMMLNPTPGSDQSVLNRYAGRQEPIMM